MGVRGGVRVVVVAALVAGAAGCSGARPTLGERVPAAGDGVTLRGARVALVIDSLASGEFTTLPNRAEARGVRLDISAQSGRRVPSGAEELRRLSPDHELVVVALGTKDAEPGLTAEAAAALIDGALRATAPDTPILWLTVHRRPGTPAAAAAGVFNAALGAAQARDRRLVVVDWAGVLTARPDLLDVDGIHLTPDGYAVRSAWLVDRMVERLAPAAA